MKRKPTVLNKHRHGVPEGAVYVGRGSKWGNPYVLGRDGNRLSVCLMYLRHLERSSDLLKSLRELKGKDLVCFCAPKLCHADFLLLLANKEW